MKLAKIISMAWIFLAAYAPQQDTVLNQKVTLDYQQTSIVEILTDLQQQYGIRFSYINNEIPDDIKVSVHLKEQPLYTALDLVLKDTPLVYQVISGQVLVKKDLQKVKRKTKVKPAKGEPAARLVTAGTAPANSAQQVNTAASLERDEATGQASNATASVADDEVTIQPIPWLEKFLRTTQPPQETLPDVRPESPIREALPVEQRAKSPAENSGLQEKI